MICSYQFGKQLGNPRRELNCVNRYEKFVVSWQGEKRMAGHSHCSPFGVTKIARGRETSEQNALLFDNHALPTHKKRRNYNFVYNKV